MTSSTDEPRSPEMPPAGVDALLPPPSTAKSLKKLFQGVCDPRKTPLFVSDDEVDQNYDLYLSERTASPASNLPTSQKEKIAPTVSATQEKITPPKTQDRVVTPRRVLFPTYSNGKLVEMDTPQSEATEKVPTKEYDESPALSSPMEEKKPLKPDISKKSKPPKGSSLSRHMLLIAAVNFLMLGVLVYFSNTVAGGEAINEIKTRISKFHGQLSNTPGASDGIVQKKSEVEHAGQTEETSWLDTLYGEAEDKIQQTYDQTQLYLQETVGYLLLDLGEKQNQILEVMYEYQESIQQATSSTTNQLLDITKYYSELETIQNITVVLEDFLQKFSGNNTWEQMGIDFSLARWTDESSPVSEYIEPIQKTLKLVLAKANLEHVHETWLASLAEHMPEMNGLDESIYEKVVEIGDTITVYYEESGLPQYVATAEEKLKETIGVENIAIMDEKWAEILDVLADYYKNNSLKEYFQFDSTTPMAQDEQTIEIPTKADEEEDSSDAISTGDSSEEMEEESSESLESSTEDQVDKDSLPDDSAVMDDSTDSDSLIDGTEIAIEDDIDDDSLEAGAGLEAGESESQEVEQPDLDEGDEVLTSDEDIDIDSSDPVVDETDVEMLTEEEVEEEYDDAEIEGDEEEYDDAEIDEGEEDLGVVEEDSTEEVLEEPTPNDYEESVGSEDEEEDEDEPIDEEPDTDEPASEEEKAGYEDNDIDPEIIDNQSSLGEEETEIEENIVDSDMDGSAEAGSEEDAEDVVEDEDVEEELEDPVLSESEGELLPEGDVEKEVEEESSSDGKVTNDILTDEESEDFGLNDSEEDSESEDDSEETIHEESEFIEGSVEEEIEQEIDEETTIDEAEEVVKEEMETGISEDEVEESFVEVDEDPETAVDEDPETVVDEEPTSMEESTITEDENPAEDAIMEDDANVEVTSIVEETDAEKDSSTEKSIQTPPRDILGLIRGIEEITKGDGSSPPSPLPPPPSDISEMIQGIESMLKEANIPRPSKEIEDEDLPELKARKNWNTSSGWLPRRQRS